MTSSPDRLRRLVAKLGISALLAGWTLLSVDCEALFPRQSWNQEWGSMVPHKSFPGDCGICHIPERWDVIREEFDFDHEKETGYALNGAHGLAACLRCHNDRGPVLVYVQRGCAGCHVDPHQGNLGMECTRCHNEDHWDPIGLIADHARTRFPLSGAHAISPCEDCHERAPVGEYRGAPVECHFCHQDEAARAVPNHVINGWQRDCTRCHDLVTWQQAPGFNHDFFPLDGAHAALNCTQCHPGGRFVPIPNTCFSCHQQDYLAAPNHVANGFSTDCTLCHNTTAWR
jgi:hypothetical protein